MKKHFSLFLLTAVIAGFASINISSTTNADEALRSLKEGNQRFVKGQPEYPHLDEKTRSALRDGQQPFAVVLACVDSRVPPELVFDRGLGDMLVIRTAGHVLDSAALGSIEFGVGVLKSPLLVVLGHEKCGAVDASIAAVDKGEAAPGAINYLVNSIEPAVRSAAQLSGNRLDNTIGHNVKHTIEGLKQSAIIRQALESGSLKLVGGVYDLDTGAVEFTQ